MESLLAGVINSLKYVDTTLKSYISANNGDFKLKKGLNFQGIEANMQHDFYACS